MNDIIRDLLKPENRSVLFVLLAIFVLFDAYVIYLIVSGSLVLKLPWFSLKSGKGGKDGKDGKARGGYRKLLFVKVTHLTDQSRVTSPAYQRKVTRLRDSERLVPVYDEAVYYTLELLPKTKVTEPRKERSSGVVDASLVIPWQDEVLIRDPGARSIKEWVQLDSDVATDTFLSVSHFENGLQGPETDVGTDVREDAEWVRLVVDFSSIPNAEKFITAPKAGLKYQGREQLVAISACRPGVFTVLCENVKKDSSIMIYFSFDWSRAV